MTNLYLSFFIQTGDDDNYDQALGEEEAIAQMESSFKVSFTNTFRECKELLAMYDTPMWQNLPSNPLFSAPYLNRLLKLYMPTVPIWSNILLGNFSRRYGYKRESVIPPCPCHSGRTTGVSESKMRLLKEAILNKKIYSRIDEVASKMGETIEAIEIQFADHASSTRSKERLLPAKKNNSARESWRKHKKSGKTTGMYTSEKPSINLVAMVNKQLIGQNEESNLGNLSI